MIRQERRRLTREYQGRMDALLKVSDKLYAKHKEDAQLIPANLEALERGDCENKKLQAYYNIMSSIQADVLWLSREITKINDNAKEQTHQTRSDIGQENKERG